MRRILSLPGSRQALAAILGSFTFVVTVAATGTPSPPPPAPPTPPVSVVANGVLPPMEPVPPVQPTARPTLPPVPPKPFSGCINLSQLSVAQRVNQLLMISGDFSNLSASVPFARSGVGAYVLFGQPAAGSGPAITSGTAAIYNAARSAGQILPWISTDEEGGSVARLAYVIGSLPSARQMAAQWTPAQLQSAMRSHASAMWNLGVIMDLAPVLDTASPTNTIADESERSFSENGQVAATYGMAYASGVTAGRVVPVLKHFPGLGHASANTDLGPATDPSLSQLQANDLIPFEQAIGAGFPVVMVSHAMVPGLTGTVPASLSPATYQYLRNTLHFNGVALTDSLAAGAITAFGYGQPAAAVRAIESGDDMAMIQSSQWQATVNALQNAVGSGTLSINQLDTSVTRILEAKGHTVCPVTVKPSVLGVAKPPVGSTSPVEAPATPVSANAAVTITSPPSSSILAGKTAAQPRGWALDAWGGCHTSGVARPLCLPAG
jgi:beta-N-acetylhexosaminidase